MLGYAATLVSAQSDGAALANTVTGVSILHGAAKYTLGANSLQNVGQMLRLTASGRISTVVTTPGTLTFEFRLGPTSNIIAATGPAFALNTVAKVNVTWYLEWLFTLRSVGSGTGAALMHAGIWTSEAVIGAPLPSAGGAGSLMIPAGPPALGTGFDSTVGNVADLQAKWSIANVANSLQLHQYALESIN